MLRVQVPEIDPKPLSPRTQDRQGAGEEHAEHARRARGVEGVERAREPHGAAVRAAVGGEDGEGQLHLGLGGRGRRGGGGEERRGGAQAGGEAVFVEAVFGPGAGVGDPARALDGGQLGLGADGLWSEAECE